MDKEKIKYKKGSILLGIIFLFLSNNVLSQAYQFDTSVKVIDDNGDELWLPWTGGLNAPQLSKMDVNGNGVEEIIFFDRSSSKIKIFTLVDNEYVFLPEATYLFPTDNFNWFLLRDYDCDGKKDIFTSDPLGIKVYQNVSDEEGIKWRLFNSRAPFPSPLLTKGLSASPINLQLNATDIPAIDDIDNDGDIDILVFKFSGSPTIEWHKNLSIERDNNCDSLQFEKVDDAWGGIEECGCGGFAFNGEPCNSGLVEALEHVSAKSLLTIDITGDGIKEVVIGEESCPQLYVLENTGTLQLADFNSATNSFPNSVNPSWFNTFPAAFYEDIDNDGLRDLFIAPNTADNRNYSVDFSNSSWLYTNTGTDLAPEFVLSTRSWLQKDMIDVGENAAPAFYDIDGDGDLDMFIGSNMSNPEVFRSSISYYRNNGTQSTPEFKLVTKDYLGLLQLGFINIKPQFEDLTGDGIVDFIFTATTLQGGGTGLFYIEGQQDKPFQGVIDVAFGPFDSNANITVKDIDKDGKMDFLMGGATGKLTLYRNIGNDNSLAFEMDSNPFYGLDNDPFLQFLSVDFGDLDGNGIEDMIAGDRRGNLLIYYDYVQHLEDPQPPVQEFIETGSNTLNAFALGNGLLPRVANIFNENKPAIVLGTGQGGLMMLKNNATTPLPEFDSFVIYPNPLPRFVNLTIRTVSSDVFEIIDLSGKLVLSDIQVQTGQVKILNLSTLQQGLYILRSTQTGESLRFVIVD